MSPTTAYLEPVAAALGDKQLESPRVRRPVSDTILDELDYAGNLFQRAQEAVDAEVQALAAAGVCFPGYAALRASLGLNQLAAQVRLQAMLARAGRPS